MSDNKKWFKVWGVILVDPSMSGLTLADMGRWVRLGAYMTTSGERGKLTITPPSPMFLLAMESESFADAKMALKRLPNVSIQELNNDNGSFIVIMKNWFKYQVDSTSYERVKRSRYKKRGEEKRSLTSTSTSTPPATLAGGLTPPRATRETPGNTLPEIDYEAMEQKERNKAFEIPEPPDKMKSYAEAKDNEVCGPPPGWAADFKRKMKAKKVVEDANG